LSAVNSDDRKATYDDYRDRYLNSPRLALKAPVDVSLELSSFCNMACTYCYHADKKNLPFKQSLMLPETIKAIIRQAADAGVNSVKFNWRGESSMNPYFSAATSLAKQLASGSTFIDRITNSNFKFTPEWSEKHDTFRGLCNQTKVKVSYDSFRPEVFERQRKLGVHALTTANIDKFYNWPGRDNILVIQAVRTKLNADEDIAGEAKKRWPSALISIRDMVGGRVEKDLSAITHKVRDYSERQSCIQAHARLIFDWDGTAVACCPDIRQELKLGNIRDKTLLEIFNSDEALKLRQDLLSLKAFENSPCKNCSSFETFKGYVPSRDS
jgi:radical SAM protein with 4Fe4S-binding SPASM domain